MKIIIKNNFHNTEVTLITKQDGHANRRQLARVKQKLCGQSDCRCGWNEVTDTQGRKLETEYNGDLTVNFLPAKRETMKGSF